MSSSNRNRKGFTLVELLVTITILAILASVTVVGYTNFIKRTAIEVDESLVEQLNIFTDAYLVKHYSNLPEDKKIIADVLDESGVKPLTLQSREYGYDLWFKCSEKTFELKENFSGNKDYIRITGDFIVPPSSTTTTTNSSSSSSSANKDDSIEPELDRVFVLENFVQNEYSNKPAYVYGTGNAIYVGLETDNDGIITATELLTENIRIKELRDDGFYQYWSIVSIEYNGIINNNDNKIIINQPGEQKIKFLLQNSANNEINSYTITLYATNISSQDTYITLDANKLNHSLELEKNANTYNATINITGLKEGISITEYNPDTSNPYTNPLYMLDNKQRVNMVMVIVINGIQEIISVNDMLHNGTVNKTFSKLEGPIE